MESCALLTNIAVIIAKDLVNDEKAMMIEPFYQIMFDEEDGDDEAECFFLHQQNKRAKLLHSKTFRFDFLNQFKSKEFENFLHISKITFQHLFECIQDLMPKRHFPSSISPQAAFSLALWKISRDDHFEEIARRFNVPLFDCQAAIRQFWKVISSNETRFIKWPAKNDVKLSKSLGVIALKRLDIFLESNDQEVQVIWQIVCNAKRKILDCYVQSLQDYDFDESPIGRVLQKQASQSQAFLIGDENFPLKTYLINPFLMPNSQKETRFNNALKPSLTCAQNVFDTVAKRFNTLYALEAKDLFEVRRIISTICCLHNLCVDINDDYDKRQQETVKSGYWSKPVHMINQRYQPGQDALKRRNDLLNEI